MNHEPPGPVARSPRHELLFWTLQAAGWTGYGLVNYAIASAASPNADRVWLFNLVFILVGVMLTVPMRALLRRVRRRPSGVVQTIGAALGLSLLFSQAWVGATVVLNPLLGMPGTGYSPILHLLYTFNLTVILSVWSGLYLGINYWGDYRRQRERTLRAESLAHQARLEMLRYQINPHFLFNALNTIRALIDEAPERARDAVTELSEFLRHSLAEGAREDHPLGGEIEAIRRYLAIESLRFESRLQVDITVDPETAELPVPAFLIHPLVENAVKYGMETSEPPLRVSLRTGIEDGWLVVTVGNSGRWIVPGAARTTHGTGIGVRNIRERLAQRFPGRHRFEVGPMGDGVEARLAIAVAALEQVGVRP